MKKVRFYAAITLLVQSLSFAIIFIILYNKKRSLAKTFAALSAVGGLAGAYLLLRELKEKEKRDRILAMDACCDMSDDDFLEDENADDIAVEDINCTFEDESEEKESSEEDEA